MQEKDYFKQEKAEKVVIQFWQVSFKKVNTMKKLILIVIGALVISACANKDVYFNGSEGSHSGMKFDKDTRHWGVNQ